MIPDQDKFHARRTPADAEPSNGANGADKPHKHDAGCAMFHIDDLKAAWWEEIRGDNFTEDAACFVLPPSGATASGPAPVVLFLGGAGHVDDKQDFLWGGVDLLVRNPQFRSRYFIVAPKPGSSSGLLRYNDRWSWTWAEDAVWACFTEVLRRLGPSRVDPTKLFATGLSLGATGVWNLAVRYGHYLAAISPVSGACEWPGNSWKTGSTPDDAGKPDDQVLARLRDLPIRAYQIDVDKAAGNQAGEMEQLCTERSVEETKKDLVLPGMEAGKTCKVQVCDWHRTRGGADWSMWLAEGPLTDWSAWDEWGGDKHFLWQRVWPLPEWGLADYFLQHSVPEERRWRFESQPITVDIRSKLLECTIKAATATEAVMKKPWREQVLEFSREFFHTLVSFAGDRPCFDKVDFYPDVLSGIQTFASHLEPQMKLPEFDAGVLKAMHLGCDKVRYSSRSWLIFKRKLKGQDAQTKVRHAVDGAREELLDGMLETTADEFITTWIRQTKHKLAAADLWLFPRMTALELFRELARTGGGMPVPLMKDMAGVIIDDWKPLTRTVNMLFDDPDPAEEKRKSQAWSKTPKENGSGGGWGSRTGWEKPAMAWKGGGNGSGADGGSNKAGKGGSWGGNWGNAAPAMWGKAAAKSNQWSKGGYAPY